MASKLPFHHHYCFYVLQLIICLWLLLPVIQAHDVQRQAYIIYMGDPIESNVPARSHHIDMLSRVLERVPSHKVTEHLLYTYENFHGCVAKLSEKEAEIIAGMDGVVSIFPNEKEYLHTTRSWNFMDFPVNVERSNKELDIVVGVFDGGIWPESESFRDDSGFGPPPAKWKGHCDPSLNFTCNNKLIGARYFRADGEVPVGDLASPRDINGHGTHTASTVAGGVVKSASFLGFGQGTARGGVPMARIAVYKVCWIDACFNADMLAAFDAAISDGVDIISMSIGLKVALGLPYFSDVRAIGSFHAMQRGILTSASAGNIGPSFQTLSNYAPWQLSVGATIIDRKFTTQIQLGNGMVFQGSSLNTFDLKNKSFPLIYGGDVPDPEFSNSSNSRYCRQGSLNQRLVKDKIVVCDNLSTGEEAFIVGAAGMIVHGVQPHDSPRHFPLPTSYIQSDDVARILSYARNLSSTPFGTILKSVESNDKSAQYVPSFSSRGPNPISPGILKPDLVAPGVSILAAWPPIAPVSGVEGDERSVPFNMMHGTSMACPHATAIAAYVKSFHPNWSPAAIKSALMTTALPMRNTMNGEAELAYGSGHLNPIKATNPGLVYDADESDYVKLLCKEGLSDGQIRLITGDRSRCHGHSRTRNFDLNYPSFSLPASLGSFETTFTRTVTNVGSPNSTYKATVSISQGKSLGIKVQPSVLRFEYIGQKLSYRVKVSGSIGMRALMSASLVWDDGQHQVRSPIVVFNLS